MDHTSHSCVNGVKANDVSDKNIILLALNCILAIRF
jgi:hypothetical protein